MITELSILIPTYNQLCTQLVHDLYEQVRLLGIDYEIIIADDGSTDKCIKQKNSAISKLSHVYYITKEENRGRAAIRNFLAQQAQYDWLLFIDSDMVVCRTDFLRQYMAHDNEEVVYGGVIINGYQEGNLRCAYEHQTAHEHTLEKRQKRPYHDFHTANFMICRERMIENPFDERYRQYGYEDVAFGILLKEKNIHILHIDNPVSFEVYENNSEFVNKTEEGLRTLWLFREELRDYSRLIHTIASIPTPALSLIRLWHTLFGQLERRQLTGSHPRLWMYHLYRLGYYASLKKLYD